MLEFTGERVVPGQVDVDLWNEHMSRYAFAAQFAAGRRVLDMGCGSGYGSAELSRSAASVVGIDLAPDAVRFARAHYPMDGVRFLAASAAALPFRASSFDLITAFEVIEHLSDWQLLLAEVRRLLAPTGMLVISTPNKAFYTESRGDGGKNPFHVHEFEFAEFRDALEHVFPHVQMLLHNRSEAQVFYPPKTWGEVKARLDSSGGAAEAAHYFVALCSAEPLPPPASFVWVPRAANVLAERQRHIAMIAEDLERTKASLAGLYAEHQRQKQHLEEQNRWGQGLEADLKKAQTRIVELQDAFAAEQKAALEAAHAYQQQVDRLEQSNAERAQWALDTEQRLTAEIHQLKATIGDLARLKDDAESTLAERTEWALGLERQLAEAQAKLTAVSASRWVRAGRRVGLGPEV